MGRKEGRSGGERKGRRGTSLSHKKIHFTLAVSQEPRRSPVEFKQQRVGAGVTFVPKKTNPTNPDNHLLFSAKHRIVYKRNDVLFNYLGIIIYFHLNTMM